MNDTTDPLVAYAVSAVPGYAGDVAPREAWRMLAERPDALLVDVRTTAEWTYVGGPDVSALGKDVVRVDWQVFPAMTVNAGFVAALAAIAGAPGARPLLMLCRSGVRSAAAAKAMTAAGYARAFNVKDGFEGPMDSLGRRGGVAGWKAGGLSWRQS